MNKKDKHYLKILTNGLISIRDAAYSNNLERCNKEIEHIEDIPNLVNSDNYNDHYNYINNTRFKYLNSIKESGDKKIIENADIFFAKYWKELELEIKK